MTLGLGVLMMASAFAVLEPVSPIEGKAVQLVPDDQKKVMNVPTLEARIKLLQGDKKLQKSDWWRRAVPFVLKGRTTCGEKGPWKVEVGKTADLSDARVWYLGQAKVDKATGRETDGCVTVRDRDTMEQVRMPIDQVKDYIMEKITF